MRYFTQSLTLMGHVSNATATSHCFTIRCRSGDAFEVHTSETTAYRVMKNLDGLDRDRVAGLAEGSSDGVANQPARYVHPGRLIVVHGVYQEDEGQRRFDARIVHLVHSLPHGYLFEETHWWLTQVTRLADEWLEDIFGDRRSYRVDDFVCDPPAG